jgi:hypothetical protein
MKKILAVAALLTTGFSYGQSIDSKIQSLQNDSIELRHEWDSLVIEFTKLSTIQKEYKEKYKENSSEITYQMKKLYGGPFGTGRLNYLEMLIRANNVDLLDSRRLKAIGYK